MAVSCKGNTTKGAVMKDIERLLTKNNAKPARNLGADFTENIVSYLDNHPRKSGLSKLKELLFMKFYTKPVIAIFAIMTLAAAGGTAYAAVGGWPGIQALFGGQKKVDNARIVKVDTKNCKITNAFNITSKDQQQDAYYYKVKDDSKLTNEQVVQMVRGYCELDRAAQASLDIVGELNKNPLNKDKVVGHYIDSKVTAISGSSISLESDVPIGDEVKTFNQTFPHIDSQVIVYEGAKRLTLGDIKVGDHVSVSYRASRDALAHSETTNPASVKGEDQVIVTIARNSKDFTASINYQKYNGKEFEQVIPCSEDTGGYCTAEQYHKK